MSVSLSCPTLCDPMECRLPGSSVYGIVQAIILECLAFPFSGGSPRPGDRTPILTSVPCREPGANTEIPSDPRSSESESALFNQIPQVLHKHVQV